MLLSWLDGWRIGHRLEPGRPVAVRFWIEQVRSKERGDWQRVPVVMSQDEVARVLEHLPEGYQLMARLQYGRGLRISELMGLRVKDIDWSRNQVEVREAKGDKSRVTMLP